MNCEPNSLIQSARCYQCVPESLRAMSITYELARLAGEEADPQALMRNAAQFIGRIPSGAQESVHIKLLCDILNSLT